MRSRIPALNKTVMILKDIFVWFVCLQQLELEAYLLVRKMKHDVEECGCVCVAELISFLNLEDCEKLFLVSAAFIILKYVLCH